MKIWILSLLTICLCTVAGCGRHNALSPENQTATILYRPTEAEAILSCLNTKHTLSNKGLKAALKISKKQHAAAPNEANTLQLICLSLHPQAGYRQFNSGMKLLDQYANEHPGSAPGLQGLQQILQRLNREQVARWRQTNKTSDEKEILAIENKELTETNDRLEQSTEQDQARIEELRQQIEQLKNIETIMKNRDH